MTQTTCKKCAVMLPIVDTNATPPAELVSTIGYNARTGGIICGTCLARARAERADHDAARDRHREHQTAQRARFQAQQRANGAARRRRRVAERRRRMVAEAENREVDRIAAGGHPWPHDED